MLVVQALCPAFTGQIAALNNFQRLRRGLERSGDAVDAHMDRNGFLENAKAGCANSSGLRMKQVLGFAAEESPDDGRQHAARDQRGYALRDEARQSFVADQVENDAAAEAADRAGDRSRDEIYSILLQDGARCVAADRTCYQLHDDRS